jgi:hypothetical protein
MILRSLLTKKSTQYVYLAYDLICKPHNSAKRTEEYKTVFSYVNVFHSNSE